MDYSIIVLPRARHELIEAWEWYEDRQIGLGDRFKEEVSNILNQIQKHPEHFPERKKNYREAKANIFPYLIIYRLKKRNKIIAISSIFHTSRNPIKKY